MKRVSPIRDERKRVNGVVRPSGGSVLARIFARSDLGMATVRRRVPV